MTVPVPGHTVGDHTGACRPDRRVNSTRPVEKAYRDPIGDAEPGHGDITGVWISDLRGVITFSFDVKHPGRNDGLSVAFDTHCLPYKYRDSNYALLFWTRSNNFSNVELWRFKKDHEIVQLPPPTIIRTRSRRSADAYTYTFRINSSRLGGATAFKFIVAVSFKPPGEGLSGPSDNFPTSGYYAYYDLLSR
jgi:hypothetical protein